MTQSPTNKKPKLLQKYVRESVANSKRINIETQTEWSWLQDMQLLEKLRLKEKFDFDDPDQTDISRVKSVLKADSELDYDFDQDNDDSSSSQAESPLLSINQDHLVDSVGPPKILKYIPESKKVEVTPPSPTISIPYEPIEDLGQFMKDFNVHLNGGQSCEFCKEATKPWPSISSQEIMNPDEVKFILFHI